MAARKTKAKKAGKPRIEIDLDRVTELAAQGLTNEQIAAALGISRTTLQARKRESELFAQAIEKGQALGIEAVSNALFENAKAGNVTAQIFFLKARAKWKDRHDEGGEGDDETVTPVEVRVEVKSGRADAQ